MSKFHVGDRVRVSAEGDFFEGYVGEVVFARPDGTYVVRLDGGEFSFGEEELRPADIKPQDDVVDHPAHYTQYKGFEVIDITENFNFNRGCVLKYVMRAGLKDPAKEIEDLKKAAWYIDREINRLQNGDSA